jgi:hypothetical protein
VANLRAHAAFFAPLLSPTLARLSCTQGILRFLRRVNPNEQPRRTRLGTFDSIEKTRGDAIASAQSRNARQGKRSMTWGTEFHHEGAKDTTEKNGRDFQDAVMKGRCCICA